MTAAILARVVRGLEWVAADEIVSRAPDAVLRIAPREVRVESVAPDRLLELRTVDDLFWLVGELDAVGGGRAEPARLADRLAALDWPAALDRLRHLRAVPRTPRLDVVASLAGRRSFNRYALENSAGPVLASRLRAEFVSRAADGAPPDQPDVSARLIVRGDRLVAALRLGVRPLHRRPYKAHAGPGTLHPPVAAALGRLADPRAGQLVADPFCGDGTVAIETALSFPATRVVATDLDPTRLAAARHNARLAGVTIRLARADAAALPWRDGDVIVTNPPWNVTVGAGGRLADSMDRFWRRLPDVVAPHGRVVAIVDAAVDAPTRLTDLGYRLALATQIRLAGHVAHVLLCAPPGCAGPNVPAGIRLWRARAISSGVATVAGW